MEEGGTLLALLRGAMFFKLRATAGTTIGGVGEGDGERRGEDGERSWWGDGVLDDAGGCRGRGVKRDLQVENKKCFLMWDLSRTCRTACWRDSGTLTRRRKTAAGCWGVVGRGRRAWRAAGRGRLLGRETGRRRPRLGEELSLSLSLSYF